MVLVGDAEERMITRRHSSNGSFGKQKKVKSAAWPTLLLLEQFRKLYPVGKEHQRLNAKYLPRHPRSTSRKS
jgi:hypothetical protein